MPRKHLIANQINKKQQSNAKLWQKLAKEIKAAVKVGGTDPETNYRLKAAIDKALSYNLSKESINRNIFGGSNKDEDNLIEAEYEIYGPNGLGIIVRTLSDNPNRVISSLNGYISKLKGSLAKPNSVKINFQQQGIILTDLNNFHEETLLGLLIDYELIDINSDDEGYEIITTPNSYYQVKEKLESAKFNIHHSELKLVPLSYVSLNPEQTELFERFVASCENDDDIQWMVANNE
ncbi:YebC/PmpR family DNA-binding transcriptional regulator [Mycoplasma bradburyae]|uniref:Probable transcriptional regulatory protein LNO68_00730 n=1 Tax=Mycoplasma bradburyae TaxID=2963128 RepID=A0AAW6HP75_9MOLU|nr:YebC/PmpR family DNA-binding transcriptional regulator [Mycoplasma bradburyae]MDC4163102.1 YebC/PmpR family DNA-binding transcriptional regulator [Mycoplasma bradburyae]MDC4181711.1 YebC/PmpR family DNA-binding transcriptional regulator [Mycoplasma bradburyae]MDC4182418.1 YebC/PmpR family DNA-binding transcriptional regulator [Mycoplasma bradburyae]MDC4183637.1 YebC/PmpR family DNA-binding transcriptional regulator [Mycoplasma bradburyae]MDC4183884.1 YebC/PmpR family DNA-binding transcripti